MASSMNNIDSSQPFSQGIPAVDTHICGACRVQFDDIYKFIDHKKLCKTSLSGLQSRSEKEYNAALSKAHGLHLEGTDSSILSQDIPHSLSQEKVTSKSQTESALNHYVWQTEKYVSIPESTIPQVETSQINNNNVPVANISCQPEASSSSQSCSNGLQLLWHHLNSSDSLGDQSQLVSEHNVPDSIPGPTFVNPKETISSSSEQSALGLELSSLRNKEALPSIDLYKAAHEQTSSDLLGSVETKSVNSIDNSTPCPEDLEVGQISAAMLGKLSKKFSSKFCFNSSLSAQDKNSTEDGSTSIPCNIVLDAPVEEDDKKKPLSVYKKSDKKFITYRNLNAASAPVTEKRNLNVKERRERLQGVSDELLTSSPLRGNQKLSMNEKKNGNCPLQSNDDSSLSSSRLSREATSISPPSLTSYKAIFTSPSSAGHRLTPDIPGPDSEIDSNKCGVLKGNEKQISTNNETAVVRDMVKTSYKDISKSIQNSQSHNKISQGADSVHLETDGVSSKNEEVTSDQISVCNYSNTPDVNRLTSNVIESVETRNSGASVEFVISSEATMAPRELSSVPQTIEINSCLPSGWNADKVDQEMAAPSGSHHSVPEERVINGETLMVAHQPEEVKDKTVVMVIKDSDDNLVMMYPGEEHGEFFIGDNQTVTTIRGTSTTHDIDDQVMTTIRGTSTTHDSDNKVMTTIRGTSTTHDSDNQVMTTIRGTSTTHDSDKNLQNMHLLLQSGSGEQELIQTGESLLSQGIQLQQQHQQQPAECHLLEKMETFSNTTGFSKGTEYFRLMSGRNDDQTGDKVPIQIIAVENGVFSDTLVSKTERFQPPEVPSGKKLLSLDSNRKAFVSSSVDAKKCNSEIGVDGHRLNVRKHSKSLKRGEPSLRMKSFSISPKTKRDGTTSRMSVEARGTSARKLVSDPSNSNKNYNQRESGGNAQALRASKNTERSFTCKFGSCSYKTNLYKDFQRHYRTHTGEKPFKCKICGKSFNRSDKLKTHMRWHLGQKPFQCNLCDYAAIEGGSLKKHMRIHTDERPFQCQICPYASRNSSQLIVHLRTHTGDSPFHCNVCSAQFKINSDLKRHMRVHTGEKPFKCDKCDYRSSNKGNLKSHNKINHSSENETKCPQCSFATSSLKRLREHKKTHDAARVIKCTVCPYTCNSATALRSHMLVHNSDKPFSCSACQYSCKQSGNLKKHMLNVHGHGENRVKIFIDPSASKETVAPVSAAKHVRIVENNETGQRRKRSANCRKMFMCNKCDCGFVRQDSLRCHLKCHRQRVEKDESVHGDKRLEKRLIPRTGGSSSKNIDKSNKQISKPPLSFVKRQGLHHIVAAASQLYQEQYMRNDGVDSQTHSREDDSSNLLSQDSSDDLYCHDEKLSNQQTEFPEKDNTPQLAGQFQTVQTNHHSAETSSQQHGTVPWEHSCYTLSSSKSRKYQSMSSNSSRQTLSSLKKPSSDLPLVTLDSRAQQESSNTSSLAVHQALAARDKDSAYSGTIVIENNANTLTSSQSGTIVMRDSKTLVNTGSAPQPVTIIQSQPQSSDIHFLVQRQPMITPSTLPNFRNSQQPTLVMTQESMEMGASDSQVTFQVLPQVASISPAGSQVATFTQDLAGQLSLQATPTLPASHGTPIQISFPTGTQFIPQGSTVITQPQIMFQLTGGTRQLNQNGQEIISIAPNQSAGMTNPSLVNQAPQIVLGNIPSYGIDHTH